MKKIIITCQILVVVAVISAWSYGDVIKGNFSDVTVSGTATIDNLVVTGGIGGASITEIGYLGGVTSSIQSQLNAKQADHANLTTISASPTNKIFYTDNNGVLQSLTIGGDNTYLHVTGTTLEFAAGTSGGSGTVTSLDNTTMDNTVIGGTTPVAGTFTTGAFTSLSLTSIDNTEFGYLDGVTSAIQTQINLKAALIDPTFTNNVTIDNELTVRQVNTTCSYADNECFLNVGSNGNPSAPAKGDQYYNLTDNVVYAYDNTAWRAQAAFVGVPASASATCSPGMISADNTYFYDCRATNTWMRFNHATW